jgi:hypothetical protein
MMNRTHKVLFVGVLTAAAALLLWLLSNKTEYPTLQSGRHVVAPNPRAGSGGRTEASLLITPGAAVAVSSKHVDALIRTPQHEWQKGRVANIEKETIKETIQNFAKFDDLALAQTSISGLLNSPTSGSFQVIVVTRLARVRRLLEIGRQSPESVLPFLRDELRKNATDWPEAFDQRMTRMADADNQSKAATLQEADKFEGAAVGAAASTYLVGELGDKESLALLVNLSELNDAPKRYGPVPPALLLGAMREIIKKIPETSLSQESRTIRTTFLKEADDNLNAPRETTVTTWNAQWDESDPRLVMMRTGSEILKNQPTMQIRIYPDSFKDGKKIGDAEGVASSRALLLFKLAVRLTKAFN